MSMKRQKIQERLERAEQHLRNAEEYVAGGKNVESSSFLHLKDWEGKSGHPLWMKNFMIPTIERWRARKQKALERIVAKEKEKSSPRREQRFRGAEDSKTGRG
jgi:hypothetical protein